MRPGEDPIGVSYKTRCREDTSGAIVDLRIQCYDLVTLKSKEAGHEINQPSTETTKPPPLLFALFVFSLSLYGYILDWTAKTLHCRPGVRNDTQAHWRFLLVHFRPTKTLEELCVCQSTCNCPEAIQNINNCSRNNGSVAPAAPSQQVAAPPRRD